MFLDAYTFNTHTHISMELINNVTNASSDEYYRHVNLQCGLEPGPKTPNLDSLIGGAIAPASARLESVIALWAPSPATDEKVY